MLSFLISASWKASWKVAAPVVGAGLAVVALAGCVHHARTQSAYPERPPHCNLRIFHGVVPRGIYYDDLGQADAGCYLETTRTECLRQLHAQACKMGGDIIYELPEEPTRPEWREYHYKGLVAHSRPLKKEDIEEGRAPENAKVEDGHVHGSAARDATNESAAAHGKENAAAAPDAGVESVGENAMPSTAPAEAPDAPVIPLGHAKGEMAPATLPPPKASQP